MRSEEVPRPQYLWATAQRKTPDARQVGRHGSQIDERRIRVDTHPGFPGGADDVDQFVRWFADCWLRRGA